MKGKNRWCIGGGEVGVGSLLIVVGFMGESYVISCREEVEESKGGIMKIALHEGDPTASLEERMAKSLVRKES